MKILIPFTVLTIGLLFGSQALSQETVMLDTQEENTINVQTPLSSKGVFSKKRYTIQGQWTVETVDGETRIIFDETFQTKGGPDLKVYLSPLPIETLSGATAASGSVKLGVLKSNRGTQSYVLPKGVSLSDYKSLVIHCEAFSVLWGGFDLEN